MAGSRLARLLLRLEEARAGGELALVLDLLADLGYFARRGDRYVRTAKRPPPPGPLAPLLDQLALPALLGERPQVPARLLHAAASLLQPLRAAAAQRLPRGGTVLVAGWLPCGFSSELAAATGADLVLLDENMEALSLEAERLALLPPAPRGSGAPSPGLFVAFETGTPEEAGALVEKYGRFTYAVSCHRDPSRLPPEAAEAVYLVLFRGAAGRLADLVAAALGIPRAPGCVKPIYADDQLCIVCRGTSCSSSG